MEYSLGDVIETKKPHPCGGKKWEIIRDGVDYKLKCLNCCHIVIIPREGLKKIVKVK